MFASNSLRSHGWCTNVRGGMRLNCSLRDIGVASRSDLGVLRIIHSLLRISHGRAGFIRYRRGIDSLTWIKLILLNVVLRILR